MFFNWGKEEPMTEKARINSEKLENRTTGFNFSTRSLINLRGVHPTLVAITELALTRYTKEDFAVICGVRTIETQRRLMREGSTRTMNSKHLKQSDGYSHAVDLAWYDNGNISWDTTGLHSFYKMELSGRYEGYQAIGVAMKEAANEIGAKIRWGADWDSDGQHTDHSFVDWVHFELA